MSRKKNKKPRRRKAYIPKIFNQTILNSIAETQNSDEKADTQKVSFVSKYLIFLYPEDDSIKGTLFRLINSFSFWMSLAFFISRKIFDYPDLTQIPRHILWIAGTGIMSSVGFQIGILVEFLYSLYTQRYISDAFYRKSLAIRYTFTRTISFSSFFLIFIYSAGVTDAFKLLLTKIAILSENIINFIVNSSAVVISIITGVISNVIYNFIRVWWRKFKLRRKKKKISA
jgi:hypothetical protein